MIGNWYTYSVAYRRDLSSRVYHRSVVARDADDARRRVARLDPAFIATVRSPRRGKPVTETGVAHV